MRAASSIQCDDSIQKALENALLDGLSRLGTEPELIIAFASFASGVPDDDTADEILAEIRRRCPRARVFGGLVDGLIGQGRETTDSTAVSLLLVSDLRGDVQIVELECEREFDGWSVVGMDKQVHAAARACGGLLVLACPHSFSIEHLFQSLAEMEVEVGDRKNVPVFGGNLSHSPWDRATTFFSDDHVKHSGAIALVMPETARWVTLVSQGCRPIGDAMIITEMREQNILGLGGKPALEQLRHMFHQLPNREREMAMRLLLLGRAISEYSETFSHGEFLIRNIVSIDQDARSIQVSDRFKVGQTVRFHLLDAEAADADLKQLMALAKQGGLESKAGLLFSCNGRGERMFSSADHDASIVDHYFDGLPLTGFFAAGEFGPVANQNFVHGFTAVAAFLSEL